MPQRLVSLDNSQIEAMLRNPAIVREFHFMSGMAAKLKSTKSGCGGCGRKTRTNQDAFVLDYEGLKTAIGQLPKEKKDRLLVLLDTEKIRVLYQNARGQKVRMTYP